MSLSFILNLTGSKRAALQFFFSLILFLQGFHVFLSPPIAHASPFQRMVVALLPVPFERSGGASMASNPRFSNGNLRRKHRARFKAMGAPCGICRGRLGPIHYDEPSDAAHPLSFVIDEIRPISRFQEFGYGSREEAAQDWNNLQAAHYCCNSAKSNHLAAEIANRAKPVRLVSIPDGDW